MDGRLGSELGVVQAVEVRWTKTFVVCSFACFRADINLAVACTTSIIFPVRASSFHATDYPLVEELTQQQNLLLRHKQSP
jgi:hypothetical protein